MTYRLFFIPSAKKEWDRLPLLIKDQFRKKLGQRLDHPHIPKDKLGSLQDCYKIKLRDAGYRLVYRVNDHEITVTVIAAGKRDKMEVYLKAHVRIAEGVD